MKTRCLKIKSISATTATQIRARIDTEVVDEYAGAMTDGDKFPPVVVFQSGSEYILADGFHRLMAANRNGFLDIEADVRKGSKADALKYALGANSTHGLKRTNADKHRSVELALAEWPKLSDSELARICAVSHPFVADVRRDIQPVTVTGSETRIGGDGKERHLPGRKAKSIAEAAAPAPEPTAPTAPEPPRTKDAELVAALGGVNVRLFHARRIEELVDEILMTASEDQLHAAKLALECGAKKIGRALKTKGAKV